MISGSEGQRSRSLKKRRFSLAQNKISFTSQTWTELCGMLADGVRKKSIDFRFKRSEVKVTECKKKNGLCRIILVLQEYYSGSFSRLQ